MNVQINYNSILSKRKLTNKVFFTDENLNIKSIKKFITSKEYSYVSELSKNTNSKKKISLFEFSSNNSIIIVKLKKNLKNYQIENYIGKKSLFI